MNSNLKECIYDKTEHIGKYIFYFYPQEGYKNWYWHDFDLKLVQYLYIKFPFSVIGHLKQGVSFCKLFNKASLNNIIKIPKENFFITGLSSENKDNFFLKKDFGHEWFIFYLKRDKIDVLINEIEMFGIDNIERLLYKSTIIESILVKNFINGTIHLCVKPSASFDLFLKEEKIFIKERNINFLELD